MLVLIVQVLEHSTLLGYLEGGHLTLNTWIHNQDLVDKTLGCKVSRISTSAYVFTWYKPETQPM